MESPPQLTAVCLDLAFWFIKTLIGHNNKRYSLHYALKRLIFWLITSKNNNCNVQNYLKDQALLIFPLMILNNAVRHTQTTPLRGTLSTSTGFLKWLIIHGGKWVTSQAVIEAGKNRYRKKS